MQMVVWFIVLVMLESLTRTSADGCVVYSAGHVGVTRTNADGLSESLKPVLWSCVVFSAVTRTSADGCVAYSAGHVRVKPVHMVVWFLVLVMS